MKLCFCAAMCFLFLSMLSQHSSAQNNIPYDVQGCGGGESSDGTYYLHDTVGQPVIGLASDGSNNAKIGYWYVVDMLHIGPTSEITITTFAADFSKNSVRLSWAVGELGGLEGYNVYRSDEKGGPFTRLNTALIPPKAEGIYLDLEIEPGRSYWYRIGVKDAGGEFFSSPRKVAIPSVKTELYQNYPNPFNPLTTIGFSLAKPERVTILILDARGRLIRRLLDEKRSWGVQKVQWNGEDDSGRPVSSGVYFCRFQAGKRIMTKKLTLLK